MSREKHSSRLGERASIYVCRVVYARRVQFVLITLHACIGRYHSPLLHGHTRAIAAAKEGKRKRYPMHETIRRKSLNYLTRGTSIIAVTRYLRWLSVAEPYVKFNPVTWPRVKSPFSIIAGSPGVPDIGEFALKNIQSRQHNLRTYQNLTAPCIRAYVCFVVSLRTLGKLVARKLER